MNDDTKKSEMNVLPDDFIDPKDVLDHSIRSQLQDRGIADADIERFMRGENINMWPEGKARPC